MGQVVNQVTEKAIDRVRDLTRDVPAPCANAVVAGTDFDPDRMPAPVLLCRRWVTEIVLFAQLVRDVRRGRIQVARIANDLGAAAAVVGHVAQGDDVDAIIVWRPAARPASASSAVRRLRPASSTAAPARRKWEWNRNRRARRRPERRLALAVDPDRVHEHLALA